MKSLNVAHMPALDHLRLLAALLVFAGLRRLMCQRLGGTTGDTAGALVELAEAAVLLFLALTL